MDYFKGKIAVVTGAGQGIGKGIAAALLKHGAIVWAIDKNAETLGTLEKEFPGIKTVVVDLSDWDKSRSAFESIGPVDLLVNNAAIGKEVPFLDFEKTDIDNLIDVNFKAVVNAMQVFGKSMKDRGTGGAIVNISSVLSVKLDMAGKSIYGATKAAIEKITKAAAFELGKYKIRINSIHPTMTRTEMAAQEILNPAISKPLLDRQALGRVAEIEDIVGPVLFLLNENLSSMVTAESLFVDGGLK